MSVGIVKQFPFTSLRDFNGLGFMASMKRLIASLGGDKVHDVMAPYAAFGDIIAITEEDRVLILITGRVRAPNFCDFLNGYKGDDRYPQIVDYCDLIEDMSVSDNARFRYPDSEEGDLTQQWLTLPTEALSDPNRDVIAKLFIIDGISKISAFGIGRDTSKDLDVDHPHTICVMLQHIVDNPDCLECPKESFAYRRARLDKT